MTLSTSDTPALESDIRTPDHDAEPGAFGPLSGETLHPVAKRRTLQEGAQHTTVRGGEMEVTEHRFSSEGKNAQDIMRNSANAPVSATPLWRSGLAGLFIRSTTKTLVAMALRSVTTVTGVSTVKSAGTAKQDRHERSGEARAARSSRIRDRMMIRERTALTRFPESLS